MGLGKLLSINVTYFNGHTFIWENGVVDAYADLEVNEHLRGQIQSNIEENNHFISDGNYQHYRKITWSKCDNPRVVAPFHVIKIINIY